MTLNIKEARWFLVAIVLILGRVVDYSVAMQRIFMNRTEYVLMLQIQYL
jgi:hypothetical protein